jgi:hypothetical protein
MAGKATFLGGSSETTYITSTGLGAGVPLVTTDYTLAIQFLSFSDVDTGLAIDGQINAPVALDWTGVNFQNVPNAFHINYCDNFVYTKGAFLNSKGARFSGTHGTIAFNNCLLAGDGLSGNIIELDNTVQIIRRFRIIYSSVIVFGSTDGIYIDALATIPNQQFILDTVSFSGSSQIQYLPTINYTSNISLFLNCTGIINSADISQYYMNNNATATVIGSIGVPVKAAGTTLSASVTQKFTNTDNRATYVGALSKYFTVTATLSLTSGNNNQIGIYIARNGTILPESEIYITTNGAGRAEAAVVQSFVLLSNTDYVEIWVENETAATNITVTELNVMIA